MRRARVIAAASLGVTLAAITLASCTGDLFHTTSDWETLCQLSPTSAECLPPKEAGPDAPKIDAGLDVCKEYCDEDFDACHAHYDIDRDKGTLINECRAACGMLLGSPEDRIDDRNSFTCRLARDADAKKNGVADCSGASLAGDGICGDNCDSYCQIITACPDAFGGSDGGFTDHTNCVTTCRAWGGHDQPYYYDDGCVYTQFDCFFSYAITAVSDSSMCHLALPGNKLCGPTNTSPCPGLDGGTDAKQDAK